jgi:hypothetical protein
MTSLLKEATGKKFSQELQRHLEQKITKFSKKGFKILQNINDRDTLQKQLKCANDPIYMTNKIENPMARIQKRLSKKGNDPDILKMGLDSR